MSSESGWASRWPVAARWPAAGLFLSVFAYGCAESPQERVYVEVLGTDTTAIETFTRTEESFEGRRITRIPVTRVAHYRGSLGVEGHVSHLDVEWTTPAANPDGPPPTTLTVDVAGDSATLIRTVRDGLDTVRIAAPPGAIPTFALTPIAIWEQAVEQARSAGSEEKPYEFLFIAQNGRLAPNAVQPRGADTVAVAFFGSPLLASVNEAGHITGLSGRETTMQVEVNQADATDVDVGALASDFAARDASGNGFGIASPTDTVRASSAGAALEIVYSRPAKRGREIWGGLVPWNTVWRTGANAATQFTTDRDLVIGETDVPAGEYTLWSTYTPDSATLIINAQTGIWGTAYDAAHDFAHISLSRESLPDPVERFTMDIRPVESGGALALSWDRTRFSVPIRGK